MRLQNWFISRPDESQIKVLNTSIDENIIVQGAAGSGKTNMAIFRARQADNKPFVIIVYTVALKKMVSFGLNELGLNKDSVVHEWSWKNRGIEISGDVYCLTGTNSYGINPNILFLQNDQEVEAFIDKTMYDNAIKSGEFLNYKVEVPDDSLEISIDFGQWVENKYYYTFYRRARWFKKICLKDFSFNPKSSLYELIPSGFLFHEKGEVDYIIIDEGQDFSINDYSSSFIPEAKKAISIFGDTAQLIYPNKGISIASLIAHFKFKSILLQFNYRTPKTISRLAQSMMNSTFSKGQTPIDLITNNKKNEGNSDFPVFPKPVLKKCISFEDELNFIIRTIRLEDLDDVCILLPNNEIIEKVHSYFSENNIKTQVKFTVDLLENIRNDVYPRFKTIDTLDFTNNDNPTILTYHSAKGTEFDNVFIPFSNDDEIFDVNPFYVALTRSRSHLYISYSRYLTKYLASLEKSMLNILT